MAELHIADDLALPAEAVTQTFAILAKRGSGKTYTALVFVEELLGAGLQTVVVDPVGVAWGLRSSADGEGPGLPITVLGGEHGDLAIGAADGETIADVVIDTGLSFVVDLSLFRKGEQTRFVTDFAERLYHRNRSPLQVVLDEADAFAPQRPIKGQERMLGAIEDLVRRGRARGLGVTLITQRPAVLHKDVLTQVEVLVALRLIAPQDREAIDAWIRVHGTPEQRAELMASLPSLPIGTAWVWSPGWLDLFQRVQIRKRRTFDSSATPKVGQIVAVPKVLASVDLDAIRARLGAAVTESPAATTRDQKRATAEQGRVIAEQQQRIADLERQIRERPAFDDSALDRLKAEVDGLRSVAMRLIDVADGISSQLVRSRPVPASVAIVEPPPRPAAPAETRPRGRSESRSATAASTLTAPQQRILDALASLDALGICDVARANVAVFADASPKSSAFGANLSKLAEAGLIVYPSGGMVAITNAGRALAPPQHPITGLSDLHDAWRAKLPGGQWRILAVLIEGYPGSWHRDRLAERAGQSPKSSAYGARLSDLKSLGLITYPRPSQVAATGLLFPEGLR